MRPAPAFDGWLRVAEAAAWCIYVWVLVQLLPSADLGRVLHALVFSGCVAGLLTVGWRGWLQRCAAESDDDPALAWSAAVAGLAKRCLIALPITVLMSWQVGGKLLVPWPGTASLIAVLAGLAGVLRLAGFALRADCDRGRESSRGALLCGLLPVLLTLSAVLLVARAQPVRFEFVLGLHAIALLVASVLALRRLPRLRWGCDLPAAGIFADSMRQSATILFRNVDILVIGFVLAPVEAAVYLILRGVAMLLDLLFRLLGDALRDPIALSLQTRDSGRFVAQAARANLGFLLIGGAGALLLFVTAGPVLHLLGISPGEGRMPLVYLILAQSTPAIFGATHLFLTLAKLDGLRAWFIWATMPIALILTFSAAREGLVPLAATYAALQIGLGAVSAVTVAVHCGIWPGLTALFHGRIRLR